MIAVDSDETIVDARPLLPSSTQSPWGNAEAERDRFADAIELVLKEARLRASVWRSQPGAYPPTVTMTVWKVEDDLLDSASFSRRQLSISINVNPYLTHPLIYTVGFEKNGKTVNFTRWDVDLIDVEALTRHAVDLADRPAIMKPDILEALLALVPGLRHSVENRLVEHVRPPTFTLPRTLLFAGLALVLFGFAGGGFGTILVLVGIAAIIGSWVVVSRRKVIHSVVKRPEHSPRSLFLVDSWHASVPGVGVDYDELAARLVKRLTMLDPSIVQRWEVHQYRTAYRIEEQKRLTLTKGQAVVHVHIYPVTDQAFVGWDGFLNWSCWAETKPISTTVRDGCHIEFRNLTVAGYVPTEFDLVEFNVLSELVHAQIVVELRQFLREKEIEAEIDFGIIRGDRDRALSAGRSTGGADRSWRTAAAKT